MRKQIFILGILLLPIVPGSTQIPSIIQQTLALKQDNNRDGDSQKAEKAKQAVMEGGSKQDSSVNNSAKTRYERARKIKDIDKLKAMSDMEARRMMRAGDTQTYRSELEHYNLGTPQ